MMTTDSVESRQEKERGGALQEEKHEDEKEKIGRASKQAGRQTG